LLLWQAAGLVINHYMDWGCTRLVAVAGIDRYSPRPLHAKEAERAYARGLDEAFEKVLVTRAHGGGVLLTRTMNAAAFALQTTASPACCLP
jgi:hypothetical protein